MTRRPGPPEAITLFAAVLSGNVLIGTLFPDMPAADTLLVTFAHSVPLFLSNPIPHHHLDRVAQLLGC